MGHVDTQNEALLDAYPQKPGAAGEAVITQHIWCLPQVDVTTPEQRTNPRP